MIRDGKRIAEVTTTTFDASAPGEYQVIGVADDGTEGFASEPRSTRENLPVQMPAEAISITSSEIVYKPTADVTGYHGSGFLELDKATPAVKIPVNIDKGGNYSIRLRYANGNGPVNTENRCGIRSITVDGKNLGIVVMPQRGRANWNDWGLTNSLTVNLTPGSHIIGIEFRPEDENMNIDTNHVLVDELQLTSLN